MRCDISKAQKPRFPKAFSVDLIYLDVSRDNVLVAGEGLEPPTPGL